MVATTLRWLTGQSFVGIDSGGHSVTIGRSSDDPNQFIGLKPSDLLLLSVVSCPAYDIVEILRKQREPLLDFVATCEGTQLPQAPYTFTHIHIHYQVYGAVDHKKLEKAISLSEGKYCSVISTLRKGTAITSDYEIIP
jgi:putative redox protein